MKRPHLVQVEDEPGRFESLFRAAAAVGLKVGWLDLDLTAQVAGGGPDKSPWPSRLGAAASLGALRAVAVGRDGSVAVKSRGGPPVFDDLLREHFLGCRLVLVRGRSRLPRLTPTAEGFRVEPREGRPLEMDAPALVDRLARPRPWARDDGD